MFTISAQNLLAAKTILKLKRVSMVRQYLAMKGAKLRKVFDSHMQFSAVGLHRTLTLSLAEVAPYFSTNDSSSTRNFSFISEYGAPYIGIIGNSFGSHVIN